jgi:hypothetical protein
VTGADVLARARQLASAAAPGASAVVGWVWSHRTLVLAGVVVVLVALNLRACRRAGTAEAGLAAAAVRAAQEAQARGAGVPVVEQVPQPAVDEEARRILEAYPEVRAERDRLAKQVGKLRALLVVRGQTDPVPAHAPERPGEPPAAGPSAPRVLLREGDGLRLELAGVGVEGDKGARALLLTVAARRAVDGEELGRGPLSVALTQALAPEAEACPSAAAGRRWRGGPVGGLAGGPGGGGWLAGLGGTYRLDLWGWHPDLFLAGGAGTGGAAGLAGVLF